MKPLTRLNIGMIFGLLVVAVFLLMRSGWLNTSSVNLTPSPTTRPPFMSSFGPDISQIQVVNVATNDRFVAKRGPDTKWQILQAKAGVETKYGVDDTKIENAVTVLASITANNTFNQIEALAQYGLDKPVSQIIVTDKTGDTTITVGGENPDKSSYYVKKSGTNDVYLISTFNLQALLDFLTDPPYLTATPVPGTIVAATPSETATPSGSETAIPTVHVDITVQFTPRATETPTPTETFTPAPTNTPGPSPTPTKGS